MASRKDQRDQSNSVRVTDENSGNVITISGGNDGDFNVVQGGDKKITETGGDVVTNVLSSLFRRFFETTLGQSLDRPMRVVGWLILPLYALLMLCLPVAGFAAQQGYERIEQFATSGAILYRESTLFIVDSWPLSLVLIIVCGILVAYAVIRSITMCDECGPYMRRQMTKKHYDRAYEGESGGNIVPEDKIFQCRNCEVDEK